MISCSWRPAFIAFCKLTVPLFLLTGNLAATGQTAATSQTSQTTALTVNLTGARNAKGKIIIWLFENRLGFPSDTTKIARQASVDIDPQTLAAHVTFRGLTPGNIAVTVVHDENNNGKMDKNFIGLPKEGVGASNNPKLMRAPKFDEAKVVLSGAEQTIEVKLGYVL